MNDLLEMMAEIVRSQFEENLRLQNLIEHAMRVFAEVEDDK